MTTLSPPSTVVNRESLFNKQRAFPLQQVIHRVSQRIENRLARSKRQAAVQRALLAVVARHPDWDDAGFDEHFVAHRGAPLFDEYFHTGQFPKATALALTWSDQFVWQPESKRRARLRFLPIAQDFVYILEKEQAG